MFPAKERQGYEENKAMSTKLRFDDKMFNCEELLLASAVENGRFLSRTFTNRARRLERTSVKCFAAKEDSIMYGMNGKPGAIIIEDGCR